MTAMPELRRHHAEIRTKMSALNDAHPDGDLGSDGSEWTRLDGEIRNVEQAMERRQRLDDLDRRGAATPVDGSGDASLDREIAKVGLLDVVRAQLPGIQQDHGAGRAREVSQELERRSGRKSEGMFWSMRAPAKVEEQRVLLASGSGANIIGSDYRPDLFIDVLRAKPRVRQLGARVLGGLTGNVAIPRRTASSTAFWVAENSPISVSDPGFDQVTMTPKHCGSLTEFSRTMILQSSPDVEQLCRDDMANVLANALDSAAIKGTGTPAPTGLLNTGSLPTVAFDSPAVYYDTLATMAGTVISSDVGGGSMGWHISPVSLRSTLTKVKDGYSRPYGLDLLFQGFPYQFSNVPSGDSPDYHAIIFGDWSDLVIGFWSELDILVNPFDSTAYPKGSVRIRAMLTVDVAVRHIQSFVACTTAA